MIDWNLGGFEGFEALYVKNVDIALVMSVTFPEVARECLARSGSDAKVRQD
ncbi:hypothetical protein ACWDO0_34435 [Nocardia rhamnosiphila]